MLVTFVPKNPVASLGMVSNNKLSLSSRTVCIFILLTLIVLGGGLIQPALFSNGYFSLKLKCRRAQIS